MKLKITRRKIGYQIKKARLEKHLTQAELAEMIGVSTTYYSTLERGKKKPSLERLITISIGLDVGIESLLMGCVELGELPSSSAARSTREALINLITICSESTVGHMYVLCKSICDELEQFKPPPIG